MQRSETFRNWEAYLAAVEPVATYLRAVSRETQLHVSLEHGVVPSASLDDSAAYLNAAGAPTLFNDLLRSSLRTSPPCPSLVLFKVTSLQDLFTASATAQILRAWYLDVHLCIADHGYENFSLEPHLADARTSTDLLRVFDSVIQSQDERDVVVLDLIRSIDEGCPRRGILTQASHDEDWSVSTVAPPPPTPTFSPEPILFSRLRRTRCYWNRCTFCVQNLKYGSSNRELDQTGPGTTARFLARVRGGYRTIILADEAIPPKVLGELADAILASGERCRWTCRGILTKAFSSDLLHRMATSGCIEVLWGLESTSSRTLTRMEKYSRLPSHDEWRRVLGDLRSCGISLHLNLIGAFPGESVEELEATVAFATDVLANAPGGSFTLNQFTVFRGTPIERHPARFGIRLLPPTGGLAQEIPFEAVAPSIQEMTERCLQLLPTLGQRILDALSLDPLQERQGGGAALALYLGSGHGAILKGGRVACDTNGNSSGRHTAARHHPATTLRRVFLTGATGAAGSAVVEALLHAKVSVTAMVRPGRAVPGCRNLGCDLASIARVRDEATRADAIVHLAHPRTEDWESLLHDDVGSMGTLLSAWHTGNFVYASSQSVYGPPTGAAFTENSPVNPTNWYDVAKICNEHQLAVALRQHRGNRGAAISLRMALLLGPSQNTQSQFLPWLADHVRRGTTFVFDSTDALTHHGSSFLGDRDFGRAVVNCLDITASGPLNVASGFVTWRELIGHIDAELGTTSRLIVRERTETEGSGEFVRLPQSTSILDATAFHGLTATDMTDRAADLVHRWAEAYAGRLEPSEANC